MPSPVLHTESAPPSLSPQRTGVERFRTLVELERIRLDMRAIAVDAFGVVSEDVPVDAQEWLYDLRRGRGWIGGGTMRFFLLLARRAETPETHFASRALALSLLALLHRALDVLLPEIPEPAPSALAEPRDPVVRRLGLKVVRTTPAHGASVIQPRRAA